MPRSAVILAVLFLTLAAQAQTPGFWFLPAGPGENDVVIYALSRDGSRGGGAISYVNAARGADPFMWTAAGGRQIMDMGSLGQGGSINGVSTDSQITAGVWYQAGTAYSQRPYRRIGLAEPQVIPPPSGFTYGIATGMSDDGNVIAGTWRQVSHSNTTPQPFIWTPSGGTMLLGQLSYQAQTTALSRDGSTIVGFTGGVVAFAWTQQSGFQTLPSPPGAVDWSANAVNTDGTIIVGHISFSETSGGFARWVGGTPESFQAYMTPVAVSDDGTVIPGNAYPNTYVWSDRFGFLGAVDYFVARGAMLPSEFNTYGLTAMSPDGRTFAGRGSLNGVFGAYIVTLPPPCGSADFNSDGDTGTDLDIESFFACIAGDCCPTCGSSDFNGDGDIATDADIEAFFRVLAGGPC
jgi:hypothetical protein